MFNKKVRGDNVTLDTKECRSCGRTYKTELDFTNGTSRWRKCDMGNLWFNCKCSSTLMVPKGKFDWYKPGANLSDASKSIFNSLEGIDQLPYIPTIVMQFQTMLQDEKADTPDLAKLIKQEPILASEIISLANRLKNSRTPDVADIKTIEHAITFVGRNELKDYALAISIKSFSLNTKTFDSDQFWDDAFIRGAVAENLLKDLSVDVEKDEAYLAATLCNVGKLVGAILFPEDIDAIDKTVKDLETMTTWKKAESDYPRCNHSILGEIGASIWGLPEPILRAARYHHKEVKGKGSLLNKNCVEELSALANIMVHWIRLEPSRIDEQHLLQLLDGFNLDESKLEKLIDRYRGLRFLQH